MQQTDQAVGIRLRDTGSKGCSAAAAERQLRQALPCVTNEAMQPVCAPLLVTGYLSGRYWLTQDTGL